MDVPTLSAKKRQSVIQIGNTSIGKSSELAPIASLEELSEAGSVISITSVNMQPRYGDKRGKNNKDGGSTSVSAPVASPSDQFDDDMDDEDAHAK